MTRVRDLDFRHPAALYRGDGSGIAVIARDRPFADGSCWARVESAGAGITAEYLHLERRSGGLVEGRLIVEDEVSAVAGDASAEPPRGPEPDPRLNPIGSYGEVEDAAHAREADVRSGAAAQAANDRIAANSFTAVGHADGRRWRVRVGPTIGGTTTLECHADGDLLLLTTDADRAVLDRARTQSVTIIATADQRRRLLGGTRPRTIEVELTPEDRRHTS